MLRSVCHRRRWPQAGPPFSLAGRILRVWPQLVGCGMPIDLCRPSGTTLALPSASAHFRESVVLVNLVLLLVARWSCRFAVGTCSLRAPAIMLDVACSGEGLYLAATCILAVGTCAPRSSSHSPAYASRCNWFSFGYFVSLHENLSFDMHDCCQDRHCG